MAEFSCQNDPSTCDEVLLADPRLDLLRNMAWMSLCGAVILSIVFWTLRWYAFFVPIVCCVVIWACTDMWNGLILTSLNA
jgi:hypothetical protein